MIDLHCHILPGIDDGAVDVEDSVAMARIAAADGVDAVCATPHIRHDHDVRIGELRSRVQRLNEELRRASVDVSVLQGAEVAETALDSLDDGELREVSVGAVGGWVLLEPAPGPLGESLERAVGHLAERGCRALVAHPERHPGDDLAKRLGRVIRRGALVQVTAAAVIDPGSAGWIAELAGLGLVHVVGSDAHSARYGRPPSIAAAIERLATIEPLRANIEWMAREAPAAIVRGEPVEPPFAPAAL